MEMKTESTKQPVTLGEFLGNCELFKVHEEDSTALVVMKWPLPSINEPGARMCDR